jgi:hypothetical protein
MNAQYLYSLLVMLLIYAVAPAQNLNVLFIGNSYTHCNNLPAIVQEMALSLGDTLNYEMLAYDGFTLERHVQEPQTVDAIKCGNWDYVVLQEQSQLPTKNIKVVEERFYQPAQQLVHWIKESGAQPLFFMTWARRDGDQATCSQQPEVCTFEGMDSLLYERYRMIAQKTDCQLAPVGKAWRLAKAEHPEIELYQIDGSHPNLEGSFLSACMIYALLYDHHLDEINYNFLFDESLANLLKRIAGEI